MCSMCLFSFISMWVCDWLVTPPSPQDIASNTPPRYIADINPKEGRTQHGTLWHPRTVICHKHALISSSKDGLQLASRIKIKTLRRWSQILDDKQQWEQNTKNSFTITHHQRSGCDGVFLWNHIHGALAQRNNLCSFWLTSQTAHRGADWGGGVHDLGGNN